MTAANQALNPCGTDLRLDAVCYQTSHPTEYNKSRAVARHLLRGRGNCTAWRIGNTARVMTNGHCIGSQADVAASEFQFDYECATCGGNNPRAGTKVSGAQLIKYSSLSNLDYSLVSINNFDSVRQFGTFYIESRLPVLNEPIYISGHGNTLPKRFSIFSDRQGGTRCKIDRVTSGVDTGYFCDTSGGSSGSPVIAVNTHKVIALHHLGGCPNSPNLGARMNLIYPQIISLIDNNDTGTPTPTPTVSPTADPTGSPTVSPTTTPGGCASHPNRFTGSLSSGASAYQPNNSYFQTSGSGAHSACLDGPSGTDYDLYLQRWNGSAWSNVASGTSPAADETLTYNGSAGYYRYRVHAYSGSGSYTLGYTRPS